MLEKNWEFYRDSAPANLKFFEMMYLQDKENTELLGTLVKGYAIYAFAVPETLAFGDEMAGVKDSIYKKNAIIHYTTSLDYGLVFLQNKGIQKSELLSLDEKKLLQLLDDNISKKDYSTLLFLAKAWSSLIELQKENEALELHLPRVKQLFNWICKRESSIENGACDLYHAQYEVADKAKEIYSETIKKYPKHLLARSTFLEYSILPPYNRDIYDTEAKNLKEELSKWEDMNRNTLADNSDYKAVEHLNLYNAIARKRFDFIEKNIKQILKN